MSALEWFKSYLSCRSQKLCFKDCLSESRIILTGVPQGSILGPLFFIIFINSMNKTISHGAISMYADDTTLSLCGKNFKEISPKLTSDLYGVMYWLKKYVVFEW